MRREGGWSGTGWKESWDIMLTPGSCRSPRPNGLERSKGIRDVGGADARSGGSFDRGVRLPARRTSDRGLRARTVRRASNRSRSSGDPSFTYFNADSALEALDEGLTLPGTATWNVVTREFARAEAKGPPSVTL